MLTNPIRTLIVGLIVAALAYLILFDPLGEVTEKIVLLSFLIGFSIWSILRHLNTSDEVELAATRSSLAAATWIGIFSAFIFVVIMRYTPAVAELVTDIADQSTNGLSPAAVGFALGAIFTMLLIQTAYVIAKILWWTSKG